MEPEDLVTRLRAFARYEPFGHRRNLMTAAADALEGFGPEYTLEVDFTPEPAFEDVEAYLLDRNVELLKWQWDRLRGDPLGEADD